MKSITKEYVKSFEQLKQSTICNLIDCLHEDFVFISVDVDGEKIFNKVLKTSKAQPLVCAPYKNTWLRNLFNVLSES